MADPRTLRQRLVVEIGDEGQSRLDRALGLVYDVGLAGEIEARYLAGAGFGCVRTASQATAVAAREVRPDVVLNTDAPRLEVPSPPAVDPLMHDDPDPAVLAVARGAARALHQIRTIGTSRA